MRKRSEQEQKKPRLLRPTGSTTATCLTAELHRERTLPALLCPGGMYVGAVRHAPQRRTAEISAGPCPAGSFVGGAGGTCSCHSSVDTSAASVRSNMRRGMFSIRRPLLGRRRVRRLECTYPSTMGVVLLQMSFAPVALSILTICPSKGSECTPQSGPSAQNLLAFASFRRRLHRPTPHCNCGRIICLFYVYATSKKYLLLDGLTGCQPELCRALK